MISQLRGGFRTLANLRRQGSSMNGSPGLRPTQVPVALTVMKNQSRSGSGGVDDVREFRSNGLPK
jgi:hypothetical protein